MAPELTRSGKPVVTALGLLVLAMAGVLPAITATAEPKAVAATADPKAPARTNEVTTLSFDIANGRWNFTGRNVTLKDAAREIVAKAPIDIRIQDATLETVKLGVAFQGADSKQGMAFVLQDFNYSQFDDPKTGRRVYLVTSLATEVKPTPEARTTVAAAAPASTTSASASPSKVVKNLDEFRPIQPARITAIGQSQAEIDADFKREKEEKLQRAIDALKSSEANGQVQSQALVELSASGDPRAVDVLKDAWSQVQGMPTVAPQVARSAWHLASQLQFANADANALLASMSSSTNPVVRDVVQAGTQDMQRYRAAQKP